MSKWVKFGRKFTFQPKAASASAVQYPADYVGQVTDECAAKAIEKKAAVEIEAPANAEAAKALQDGSAEAVPVKVKPDPKAEETSKAGKP